MSTIKRQTYEWAPLMLGKLSVLLELTLKGNIDLMINVKVIIAHLKLLNVSLGATSGEGRHYLSFS
jgi:hypothetical protein